VGHYKVEKLAFIKACANFTLSCMMKVRQQPKKKKPKEMSLRLGTNPWETFGFSISY
jgi:hypothetical protein